MFTHFTYSYFTRTEPLIRTVLDAPWGCSDVGKNGDLHHVGQSLEEHIYSSSHKSVSSFGNTARK